MENSKENEKKKVNEKDLETMSGGCGKKEPPKAKFNIGDKVYEKRHYRKCGIVINRVWLDKAERWQYAIDFGDNIGVVALTDRHLILDNE